MKVNCLERIFVSLTIAVLLSVPIGCGFSKRYHNLPAFSATPVFDSHNHSVGRFKTTYLADQIHAYYRGHTNGTLGVMTFVDLDNLYGSSSFGRFLGEQLMTELAMRGYNVVELRKADVMQIMSYQGEFALSRDVETLRGFQNLAGVIVGTYVGSSPDRVYINARLLDPKTAMILSAGSVEMDKTSEIKRMMRSNSFAPSMERIPVKHLGYAAHPMPYYYPWQNPYFNGYHGGMGRFDIEENEPDHIDREDGAMQEPPKPTLEPNA